MNPLEPATSLTLLGKLLMTGQSDAWNRFDQLYRALLVTWARRQGLQHADADDLVQGILAELKQKLPQFDRGKAKFRAWLSTVCKNRCYDFIRQRRAKREVPYAAGPEVAIEPHLTDLEEREHKQALVNRGLELIRSDFSEQTWAAFEQLHRRGRKASDVASELGITVNAVYLASNRVLTRLRQEIDEFLE